MKQTEIDAMCVKICHTVHNSEDPAAVIGALVPVLLAMAVDIDGAETVIREMVALIEQIRAAEAN